MTPATLERHAGAPPTLGIAATVTVITPSLPGRVQLLEQCAASVAAQTIPVVHLVRVDTDSVGPSVLRSELLDEATTDLVAFVDDDDLIDPDHCEILADALERSGAELAWSYHRTEGLGAPRTPRPRGDRATVEQLRTGRNCIPVTVLARRSAVLDAGGFQPMDRYEDYALWLRMLDLGHRFTLVRRETWTYRFLGGNRTWLSR